MLTTVNTDKVWAELARFTANAVATKGDKAYIYLFSYVPESMKARAKYGAPHASEIAYVFNNLNTRRGISTATSQDEAVAKLMNAYWANFAKTGNPNGKGLMGMAKLWRDAIDKYGGDVTLIHLPEIGIKGNTHFPFSDLNNVEIADLLSLFLKKKGLD